MWDFDLTRSFGLMVRTMPFILARLAIYFGITLAYVLAIGIGGTIGYGIGHISEDPSTYGFVGGFVGFGIVSVAVYWIREYLLYVVKAGHIAVLVRLIDGEVPPDGRGQIEYAREIVSARFGETSALFALDQLIKAIIGAITGILGGVAAFIPIPGLDGLVKFVNAVIRMALTYVDELILAYGIRTGSDNPWQSARHGLVLYAQNGRIMLKNALWLTVLLYALSVVVFLIMLGPIAALFWVFPGSASVWALVVAIIFAWALKAALLEPFAIACLMDVYFRAIEGQQPDPEWDARLGEASDKFRDLAGRAVDFGQSVIRPSGI